ncbi:MAG: hypothetical protein LC713_07825, partial [Actinobacteria bacterium]|nr:hypothetical protein [Actinomycetota bacterium]
MSVLMTMVIPGDTNKFRAWIAENGDQLPPISEAGKAAGAIHHRFAVGDGHVLVLDEWPDAASFQDFFDAHSEQIQGIMGASG